MTAYHYRSLHAIGHFAKNQWFHTKLIGGFSIYLVKTRLKLYMTLFKFDNEVLNCHSPNNLKAIYLQYLPSVILI